MKAGQGQSEIAKLLVRYKSAISRGLPRNTGSLVTMVERNSGYGDMAKSANKTSILVSSTIEDKLKPMAARVKTLTFNNGKEFAAHAYIYKQLQSTTYFARPCASWERGRSAAMKISTVCCTNTFQRKDPCHDH